jgi:hypothetical protein
MNKKKAKMRIRRQGWGWDTIGGRRGCKKEGRKYV